MTTIVAVSTALGYESFASEQRPISAPRPVDSAVTATQAPRTSAEPSSPLSSSTALGLAGGAIPDGTSVFDVDVAGVANLDPDLRAALQRAADAARASGIEFRVTSGWRSAAYQERLLEDAIAKYGSRAEAARWVATPATSEHVSGDAVDVGPQDAQRWLEAHGATYDLCRIYDNEPWHFELREDSTTNGCPARFTDPTRDPRLQS